MPGLGKLVKTYDYVSAEGELLYQVCRYEPKAFRQRRPNPSGGWIWSLYEADGKTLAVPLVLYRLPDLLNADKRRMVFVTEGEKDADNLAALGCVATTSAMGAGKWWSCYSGILAGRHVCLCPDGDDPGIAHMAAVCGSLMMSGVETLRTARMPAPCKDISEWLEREPGEHARERFQEMVRKADVWRRSHS